MFKRIRREEKKAEVLLSELLRSLPSVVRIGIICFHQDFCNVTKFLRPGKHLRRMFRRSKSRLKKKFKKRMAREEGRKPTDREMDDAELEFIEIRRKRVSEICHQQVDDLYSKIIGRLYGKFKGDSDNLIFLIFRNLEFVVDDKVFDNAKNSYSSSSMFLLFNYLTVLSKESRENGLDCVKEKGLGSFFGRLIPLKDVESLKIVFVENYNFANHSLLNPMKKVKNGNPKKLILCKSVNMDSFGISKEIGDEVETLQESSFYIESVLELFSQVKNLETSCFVIKNMNHKTLKNLERICVDNNFDLYLNINPDPTTRDFQLKSTRCRSSNNDFVHFDYSKFKNSILDDEDDDFDDSDTDDYYFGDDSFGEYPKLRDDEIRFGGKIRISLKLFKNFHLLDSLRSFRCSRLYLKERSQNFLLSPDENSSLKTFFPISQEEDSHARVLDLSDLCFLGTEGEMDMQFICERFPSIENLSVGIISPDSLGHLLSSSSLRKVSIEILDEFDDYERSCFESNIEEMDIMYFLDSSSTKNHHENSIRFIKNNIPKLRKIRLNYCNLGMIKYLSTISSISNLEINSFVSKEMTKELLRNKNLRVLKLGTYFKSFSFLSLLGNLDNIFHLRFGIQGNSSNEDVIDEKSKEVISSGLSVHTLEIYSQFVSKKGEKKKEKISFEKHLFQDLLVLVLKNSKIRRLDFNDLTYSKSNHSNTIK